MDWWRWNRCDSCDDGGWLSRFGSSEQGSSTHSVIFGDQAMGIMEVTEQENERASRPWCLVCAHPLQGSAGQQTGEGDSQTGERRGQRGTLSHTGTTNKGKRRDCPPSRESMCANDRHRAIYVARFSYLHHGCALETPALINHEHTEAAASF